MMETPMQPLAEVFGFVVDDLSDQAERYRRFKLCPYNNRVPNCTKDKANDPLGVCSIYYNADENRPGETVITCPVRFRQDWLIAENAANFFFDSSVSWTSLSEIRLKDKYGQSAGNIDLVLVAYNSKGKIIDFGPIEIQSVYISGNVRKPFEYYMEDRAERSNMDWGRLADYYPRPDFLSSSRKRLAPQLLYKGGILNAWKKKQAIVLQRNFHETLPPLPEVSADRAEIAWFLYDLKPNGTRLELTLAKTVYTEFWPALNTITTPEPGNVEDFIEHLQLKLSEKNGDGSPDAPSLTDITLV
ncbi:MAG: NotI family restriction endonuclease [Chloroflexi bacterium]|nr:NotI family restriction endonuclease [Chloroflexota bacterium]